MSGLTRSEPLKPDLFGVLLARKDDGRLLLAASEDSFVKALASCRLTRSPMLGLFSVRVMPARLNSGFRQLQDLGLFELHTVAVAAGHIRPLQMRVIPSMPFCG